MALETFLLRLGENISSKDVKELFSIIAQIDGRIEMCDKHGKVVIATFDNSYMEKIRRVHCVNLIGGVTFRGAKVKKKEILKKYANVK